MLAAAAQAPEADHKVHGSSALAALARSSSEDDDASNAHDAHVGSGSSNGGRLSRLGSHLASYAGLPPSTPPLDIAAHQQVAPLLHSRSGGSSSGGRLSFLSCFGSLGANLGSLGGGGGRAGEDDDQVAACEVGIRPSFYWMDAPSSPEERLEAEATFRFAKSDCQDDACVIHHFAGIQGLTFAGVFDGHGPYGRAAAKLAAEHVPRALAGHAAALHSRSDRKRLRAMREACRQADEAMRGLAEAGFDASLSGTTACFALVSGNQVLLANVGDSRCVAARRRGSGALEGFPLTVDAKPELPEETRRVELAGGVVRQLRDEEGERRGAYRVFRRGDGVLPGLAMSRSLGDLYAHSVGVTWEPTLSTYTLSSRDQFLVLATDGLWDVMSNDGVADFVQRYRHSRDAGVTCAEALTLEAQERWKAAHEEALVDDISVAILHVSPLPPPRRRRGSSEVELPALLARAASCNDEANELLSFWQAGSDSNPSHHSPRQFFRHLYEPPDGSPGSSDSGSAQGGAGGGGPPPAVGPATAAALNATPTPPGSPWMTTPLQSPTLDASRASSSQGHPDAPPRPASSLIPIPQRGAAAAGLPPDRAQSMPAPPYGLGAVLAPIRKAYPSSNDLPAVLMPSWDGAAGSHRSAGAYFPGGHGGSDTPRSSESGASGLDARARRAEGRHEGKVRGGVPASFSSGALASSVRCSADSELCSPAGPSSRVGSVEERGLASLDEMSAHGGGGGGGYPSPVRDGSLLSGQRRPPPTSPGRTALGRTGSGFAATGGGHATVQRHVAASSWASRMVVVRQVHSSPSAAQEPLSLPERSA